MAIVNGNVDEAQELCKDGRVDTSYKIPDQIDTKHRRRNRRHYGSMIYEAILTRNPIFIRLLMDQRRFNPNEVYSPWGFTVFHLACERGCVEIVKEFLDYPGTDTKRSDNHDTKTPLFTAVASNRIEVVKLLIASGKPLHVSNKGFYFGNYRSIMEAAASKPECREALQLWRSKDVKAWRCYCGCVDDDDPIWKEQV
jgi:hypothetical protein